MPVDYSKWDTLELSDDSDIEVHPNVDKRSFIRAKQNQIHLEREERKRRVETLRYERIINDGLIARISALLHALQQRASQTATRDPGAVAFDALMESSAGAAGTAADAPPPRPEGVHHKETPLPTYTTMLSALLDDVNKSLDKDQPPDRYAALIDEIAAHLAKSEDLQRQLLEELAGLEKAGTGKITSESYRTGFSTSFVNKDVPKSHGSESSKSKGAGLTNHAGSKDNNTPEKAEEPAKEGNENINAADAIADDDEEVSASADACEFAKIPASDYRACQAFIRHHPDLLAERETDGLLVMALDAELETRSAEARQCVHQALMLQYCRALGPEGVAIFFRRVTTPGHNAHNIFLNDVQETYDRIASRAAKLRTERLADGVEQIQLQAVAPGVEITVRIPPVPEPPEPPEPSLVPMAEPWYGDSDTAAAQQQRREDAYAHACRERDIYESLPPGLRAALDAGTLDEINRALALMAVPEAEQMVALMSDANILGLAEDHIIDTTTELGREEFRQIQESVVDQVGLEPEP